jgi:ABC-2 type transport system permease protein
MTTIALTARDSATMARRNFKHTLRYPATIIMAIGTPTLLLLLFVGVFGGALTAGITGPHGAGPYINYVVPGILLMTVGYGSSSTAISINGDMTKGIMSRFRTMAIARSSVLAGHVIGAIVRTLVSTALLIGVAYLLGYRPSANAVAWLGAIGLIALLTFALTWFAVAIGLVAKTAQGTSPFILIVQTLPFVSSAFVPPASMSPVIRWLAQYEPFTPIIDTLRGLLLGLPIGGSGIAAVGWCAGMALVGFLWARTLFRRDPNR